MSEHEKIREMLPLAAADALTSAEEERVAAHMRSCVACSNEMNEWRSVAGSIRRLPTPQPSPRLMQMTLARAEAKLVEQAEQDWNRRVIIFVVVFAWALTAVSWLLVHAVMGELTSLLSPQLNRTWIDFAGFTAVAWLAGGTAAALLALRQRRERRLA